ncbi:hypothetical protein MARA_12130 [Mycolicibacterium arabiense]|uniref:MarR family transcriptional regulator n=1 Tax=Mycolicibacterium arabiense TaxID=1286181 RepID=A0A7I7RVD2_9MYCO|nr:hypothetical protein [Mycolicibacterium arabiense]MCV7373123.1 hypothetical protein [Mycolicibacterium arabiense]BBY47745.1 hypothetical protein MARA_12130 [Mycolicibacterium arabiense]
MSEDLSPTAAGLWEYLSALSGDGKKVHVTFEDVAEVFAWPMSTVRAALDELVAAGKLFEDTDRRTWHQS